MDTLKNAISIIVLSAVLAARAFGDDCDRYYQSLLQSPTRPTMEDVELLLVHCAKYDKDYETPHVQALREKTNMALAIAALERAFPGGTYFYLGRDAVLAGDIMDAFYLGIDQPGRVKRLDASHPSFRVDDALVEQFLIDSGLDAVKMAVEYPNVALDVTSFSHTAGIGGGASQSVRVMRAGFVPYGRKYGSTKPLVRQFNFVSIGGGYFSGPAITDKAFNVDSLIESQKSTIVAPTDVFKFPAHCNLMEFTYSTAWHELFGPIERLPNGKVGTRPGVIAHVSTRQMILQEMISIYRTVTDARFQAAVFAGAQTLGFHFPRERSKNVRYLSVAEEGRLAEALQQASSPAKPALPSPHAPSDLREISRLETTLQISPRGAESLYRFLQSVSNKMDPVATLTSILEDVMSTPTAYSDRDIYFILAHAANTAIKKFAPLRKVIVTAATKLERISWIIFTYQFDAFFKSDEKLAQRVNKNHLALKTLLSKAQHCGNIVSNEAAE